jgi:hypothetical protein
MILAAPARRAPWITDSPTPPQPNTATVQRDGLVDLDGADRRDDRLLGHAAEELHHADLLAAHLHAGGSVEHPARGRPDGAQVRLLVVAEIAGPADRHEGEDDVVPDLEIRDALAQLLDDARALVAEQERTRQRQGAVDCGQIGVANTAGGHLDLELTGLGGIDRELLDRIFVEIGADQALHGGSLLRRCASRRRFQGGSEASSGAGEPLL